MSDRDVLAAVDDVRRELRTLANQQGIRRTFGVASETRDIVPVIGETVCVPGDLLYAHLGLATASTDLPRWLAAGSATNVNYDTWDGTEETSYLRVSSTASTGYVGPGAKVIYPEGYGGLATSYAPKPTGAVATVVIEFTARFAASGDYTNYGVGFTAGIAAAGTFTNAASDYFIQVKRNNTDWVLITSANNSSTSDTDATADGNFHVFRVTWTSGTVALYVDDVLTCSSTTNLPDRALSPYIIAPNSTGSVDVIDMKVTWA